MRAKLLEEEGKKSRHDFRLRESVRQSRPETWTMRRERFLLHCLHISMERFERGSHHSPIHGGIMANAGFNRAVYALPELFATPGRRLRRPIPRRSA